jgi:hypothetical protein
MNTVIQLLSDIVAIEGYFKFERAQYFRFRLLQLFKYALFRRIGEAGSKCSPQL